MRKVRIGVLGCGHIGKTHAKVIQSLADQAELVAVADHVPEQAHSFATEFDCNWYTSLRELLRDPAIDAVCICTPSGLHAEHAAGVLAAEKHVVIEKPADISLQAIDALAAMQQRTKCKVAVISQHRFDRASRIVHGFTHKGAFGRITLASAQIHWWRSQAYYNSASWRGTRSADGGCLMNQAIHMVDLLQWIAGPVVEVQSFASTLAHTQIDVEDTAVATLRFENGTLGIIEATTAAYPGGMSRLEIHGDRGSATIENNVLSYLHATPEHAEEIPTSPLSLNQAQDILHSSLMTSDIESPPLTNVDATRFSVAHRAQMLDFVHAVLHGHEPLVNLEEGRKAVEIVQAMYEAGRAGRAVSLRKETMIGDNRRSAQ